MKKIAIFASGYGSNMMALHQKIKQGKLPVSFALFVSDKPNAPATQYAQKHNVPSFVFSPKAYKNKEAYEQDILDCLIKHKVDLIVLAGYMRYVGQLLLKAYANRMINIHPSLLPNFKGKNAIEQAFMAKAKETGVTVHYVDEKIDHGQIITQEKCQLYETDTIESLTERIHKIEHELYAKAILSILEENHEKSLN